MNRQIKFRGKDRRTGNWVYGDLLAPITGCRIVSYREEDNGAMKCADYDYHDVLDDTVGQFTGLLDRNGKEIYEGDILKGTTYLYGYDLPNGEQFDYKGFVEWQSQCDVGLCWILTDLEQQGAWHLNQTVHRNCIDYSTGTVIGNIHDNPELMGNEQSKS